MRAQTWLACSEGSNTRKPSSPHPRPFSRNREKGERSTLITRHSRWRSHLRVHLRPSPHTPTSPAGDGRPDQLAPLSGVAQPEPRIYLILSLSKDEAGCVSGPGYRACPNRGQGKDADRRAQRCLASSFDRLRMRLDKLRRRSRSRRGLPVQQIIAAETPHSETGVIPDRMRRPGRRSITDQAGIKARAPDEALIPALSKRARIQPVCIFVDVGIEDLYIHQPALIGLKLQRFQKLAWIDFIATIFL